MTDTISDFIKVSPRLFGHGKTLAVAERTGLKPTDVAARVMKIWAWAAQESPTGDVSTLFGAARRIGETARILELAPKSIGKFLDAVVEAGFIDVVEDRHEIHDWLDGTGGYLVSREHQRFAARERKARERGRKRDAVTPPSRVTPPTPSRIHGESGEEMKMSRVTEETKTRCASATPGAASAILSQWRELSQLAMNGTRLDEQRKEIAALVGDDLVGAVIALGADDVFTKVDDAPADRRDGIKREAVQRLAGRGAA